MIITCVPTLPSVQLRPLILDDFLDSSQPAQAAPGVLMMMMMMIQTLLSELPYQSYSLRDTKLIIFQNLPSQRWLLASFSDKHLISKGVEDKTSRGRSGGSKLGSSTCSKPTHLIEIKLN